MDRINHVKFVTPDPDGVDRFLREVVEFPEGWPLGQPGSPVVGEVRSPARDADGKFSVDSVNAFRGSSGFGGRITGSPESRQFQILQGEQPHTSADFYETETFWYFVWVQFPGSDLARRC